MKITTLRTTSDDRCPDTNTCPSEHVVDTDPRNLYVISKIATSGEREAFAAVLRPREVLGWMPAGFLPHGHPAVRTDVVDSWLLLNRQYVVTTEVSDPNTLARFGGLMADDEQLGTVPVLVAVSHG